MVCSEAPKQSTRLENPSFLCASLLCKMLADRLLIFFFLRRGASRIVVASMKDPETSESSRNKPPSSAIRNLSLYMLQTFKLLNTPIINEVNAARALLEGALLSASLMVLIAIIVPNGSKMRMHVNLNRVTSSSSSPSRSLACWCKLYERGRRCCPLNLFEVYSTAQI